MHEQAIDKNENSEWYQWFSEPEACKDLGIKIRSLREAHAWSREDLSFFSGVSSREICRIELGKSIPNQESVLQIEMALKEHLIPGRNTRQKIPEPLCDAYVPFRDDLLKKKLSQKEVELTIEVGLAKADRIIREKK